MAIQADLIETPAEFLGPSIREVVTVAGRTFLVERPDAVDRLIDHPELGGTSASEEYKPFWASLWPAARLLARAVLEEPWPAVGPLAALELGCGLGLPGIAALARGLRVTFSDYDAAACRFAAANARLNGFTDFDVLHLNWRCPPTGLRFPVLLASEPIYVLDQVDALADFIQNVLDPGGCCLLADHDRLQAAVLRDRLRGRGFDCREQRTSVVEGGVAIEGLVTWIRCRGAGC